MAGSVNRVYLIGRVGKAPEVRTFQAGGKVCNFSLATSERWREKSSGEMKERTTWHNIAVFNEHLVDVAERFVRKGSLLHIEGQIENRKYEKDGREVYVTEIVLRPYRGELTLLDGASDRDGTSQAGDYGDFGGGSYGGGYERQSAASVSDQRRAGTRASAPLDADMDDSIPF